MEGTLRTVPHGTYTMEVSAWNLHYGRYLMELTHGSYLVEFTPWKLPHGTYTMEVTYWNLHHGSYLMELTPWKLSFGTSSSSLLSIGSQCRQGEKKVSV